MILFCTFTWVTWTHHWHCPREILVDEEVRKVDLISSGLRKFMQNASQTLGEENSFLGNISAHTVLLFSPGLSWLLCLCGSGWICLSSVLKHGSLLHVNKPARGDPGAGSGVFWAVPLLQWHRCTASFAVSDAFNKIMNLFVKREESLRITWKGEINPQKYRTKGVPSWFNMGRI